MRTLAIYYVDSMRDRRRKLVLLAPTDKEVKHYLGLGRQVGGERVRPLGIFGFRDEVDGQYSEPFDDILWWVGVRTIRVEEIAEPVQLEMEVPL